jgi:hypothetical protein
MKDIILSTAVIVAIGLSAAVIDRALMPGNGQSAAVALHKLISPAGYLIRHFGGVSVTWL